MYDPLTVIVVICSYMGLLLLLALWTDRSTHRLSRLAGSPLVYSLAMAVYCTAWTYYGSVGTAATSGFVFLSTYVGPTMGMIVAWTVLRKLVRIKDRHRITSIADFLSARYERSRLLAALVTIIAIIGITPYLALQFRAVNSTFAMICTPESVGPAWLNDHRNMLVPLIMILFTISVGMRRLDPTERHPGMMIALAAENLVKLGVFVVAGLFVTYFLFDGFGSIFQRVPIEQGYHFGTGGGPGHVQFSKWLSFMTVSLFAFFLLPRQFHVMVVENRSESHIKTAMWLTPLYMFAISAFTVPIAAGGLLHDFPLREADTFVLALPLEHGWHVLSLLVFVGGFSAATGMIMVSSLTLATMATNHLLLPIVGWLPFLGFLRRRLLICRWFAVLVLIATGYWSESKVAQPYMLANIGLISFTAVFQFAPAVLGGLFWPRGHRYGAILGLSAGFAIWFYTLLLPAFIRSGWLGLDILGAGPGDVAMLHPESLFGIMGLDPVTHSVFWSMFFNVGLYVLASLWMRRTDQKGTSADVFVNALLDNGPFSPSDRSEPHIDVEQKRHLIESRLGQYFRLDKARQITAGCLEQLGLADRELMSVVELAELTSRAENVLAGSVGSAAASEAFRQESIFTREEARELSDIYGSMLAELNVRPEELRRKIDYHRERETLLSTHAKELEEKVRERTRDLEAAQTELIKRERLSVLGQLTAFVSHELRNPLAVIRSSAYYLRLKLANKDAKSVKHLNRIDEQVAVCDSIIEEMLQYTRGRPAHAVLGELNSWIESVITSAQIPEGITITRDLADDLPRVYMDREQIRGAVVNLLQNAVHALEERLNAGEVDRTTYHPRLHIATRRIPDGVQLIISDNGIGMSRETVTRATEPLFTTKARGTGLGLAIVRKIAEQHGSDLSVESRENEGTTVSFTLLVERPPEGRSA